MKEYAILEKYQGLQMRKLKTIILFLLLQPFLFAQMNFTQLPYTTTDKGKWYAKAYGLNTQQEKNYIIKAEVYIAGWSKDGKFAYAIQIPNEVRDTEMGQFIIQDMVTDKIIEKIDWEFSSDESTSPKTFDIYMKPPIDKISHLIKKYHIQSSKTILAHFPIGGESATNTVDAKLYMNWSNQPEMFSEEEKFVDTFSLKLLKTKNYNTIKRKVLHREGNMLQSRYLDAFVDGYIRSPFENRIAVLLVQIQRGWEGPPHVFNVKFVGASLF